MGEGCNSDESAVTEVLLVNSTVRIPSAPQAGHRESLQTISVLTLSGLGAITWNRCRCCEDVTVLPSRLRSLALRLGPHPQACTLRPYMYLATAFTPVASSSFILCRFHPSRDLRSSTPQRHDRSAPDRRRELASPHGRSAGGQNVVVLRQCSNTQANNSGITWESAHAKTLLTYFDTRYRVDCINAVSIPSVFLMTTATIRTTTGAKSRTETRDESYPAIRPAAASSDPTDICQTAWANTV